MEAKAEFRSLNEDVVEACRKLPEEDYFHDWHQEPQTFENLLDGFADSGWLVCDPCAGWATTAIACLRKEIKFIGCEVLPDRYQEGDDLAVLEWSVIHGGRVKAGSRPTELPPSVKPKAAKPTVLLAPDRPAKIGDMKAESHMYAAAKTWNPFKGCKFDCAYCVPSFQLQAKRQKHNCMKCYRYEPHTHPDRLTQIPGSEIVFVCGNGDIAFCKPDFVRKIIEAITAHGGNQSFYLQTKKPSCFKPFLKSLPKTVILVTTLETNRDEGYGKVSKAPKPSSRFKQFASLNYPRKVVTIEPVMDFDVQTFADWIIKIKPEYVWLGFNSREKQAPLPEPSPDKLREFVEILARQGIEVRGKKLRGIKLHGAKRYQD